MNSKTRWISRTAVLTALLIVLQFVTKPLGQIVTGSCVNAVLAVAALYAGLWSGLAVALISPFAAFLLGIGPQLLPIVPAIAAGNMIMVLMLWLVLGKREMELKTAIVAWIVAAATKFGLLYVLVVELICNVMPLKEPQIATFTTMFTWPQLITALIGIAVAMLIVPRLKKAAKN